MSLLLMLIAGTLLMVGCDADAADQATPSLEATASPATTSPATASPATTSPPSVSAPAGDTESTPSRSASPAAVGETAGGPAPVVDPSAPQTLVGVWQTNEGLELVLNGRGYFAMVNTGSGERYDNGTWEVQDGLLVLTTTVRRRCTQGSQGTYQIQTGQAAGTVGFESASDPCRGRREDLEGGLTWLRADD